MSVSQPQKTQSPPPTMPKWLLNLQVFLLRRQMMGPMNKQLMVITTTGRKSGKQYSVPIGFARDGSTFLTFNIGGKSNWYRNALVNPLVMLEVQGKQIQARGEAVTDRQEQAEVLEVYRRESPSMFPRFFQVSLDAPREELLKVGDRVVFMRFTPV